MNQGIYTVETNRPLTEDVWEMRLAGVTGSITRPGQFINIKLDGLFLRRPISISDWDGETVTIVYKIVGKGTAAMTKLCPGKQLDLLCGLGNGFDISRWKADILVIGGGAGVPPMYGLAKALLKAGKTPIAILGFNKREEIFCEDKFRALGIETTVTTADGSYGTRGFVTDALPRELGLPERMTANAMLEAVNAAAVTDGQFSLEERMGCGFGACMGCSCKTKYGTKRICKDGPVLEKEEIIW